MSSLFRWRGLWELGQPRVYCLYSGAFLLLAGASGSPYLPHPEEERLPLYNWGRGRWGWAEERGGWRERSRERRWECVAEIWLTFDCIHWPCFLKRLKMGKVPPKRMAFIMQFLWILFLFILFYIFMDHTISGRRLWNLLARIIKWPLEQELCIFFLINCVSSLFAEV